MACCASIIACLKVLFFISLWSIGCSGVCSFIYILVNFTVFISSFIPLWPEKILDMISSFLNLWDLFFYPNIWYILENGPCEKILDAVCYWILDAVCYWNSVLNSSVHSLYFSALRSLSDFFNGFYLSAELLLLHMYCFLNTV